MGKTISTLVLSTGGLEALEKMTTFYTDEGIDHLKDALSPPDQLVLPLTRNGRARSKTFQPVTSKRPAQTDSLLTDMLTRQTLCSKADLPLLKKANVLANCWWYFLPDILTSSNGVDYLTKQIKNPRAQTKVCSVVDILQMVG